jgi:hypothetical protein
MKVYPSGTNKELFRTLGRLQGEPSMTHGVVGEVVKEMSKAVIVDGVDGIPNLSALCLLKQAEFDDQKTALLGALDSVARAYVSREHLGIQGKYMKAEVYKRKTQREGGSQIEVDRLTDAFFRTSPGVIENPLPGCRVMDENGVTHYYI